MAKQKQEKFPELNKKIFELITKLIQLYPAKIVAFAKDIVDFGTINLKSTKSSAAEKESAAQMIHALIEHNAFDAVIDISQLIVDVFRVLDQKNPPIRLQQDVYELLGLLSQNHNEKFPLPIANQLRNKMLNTIQSLFKDDKASPSLTLISGAVEGLKSHLINFTPTPLEDPSFGETLYECMFNLTDPLKLPSQFKKQSGSLS